MWRVANPRTLLTERPGGAIKLYTPAQFVKLEMEPELRSNERRLLVECGEKQVHNTVYVISFPRRVMSKHWRVCVGRCQ
jgi:hypothetical protein